MEFVRICGGGEFNDKILQKCGFTQTHTHTHTHTQADTASSVSSDSVKSYFASDIEGFCIFSFLDYDSIVNGLKIELSKYLV